MSTPPQPQHNSRFHIGLIAFAAAIGCGVGIPMMSGGPALIQGKHGAEVFLCLVLPFLFVAVWGVTTSKGQVRKTKGEADNLKAKSTANVFKLGCAVFLLTPIASATIGFVGGYAFDINPLDRMSHITAYAGMGFIAGCMVSAAIILSFFCE